MIAIFSSPRPFKEEFDRIQRNAIISWLNLSDIKIFLFEDEEGTTKKICDEYNLNYLDEVKKNENGTPLMDNCIEIIKKKVDAVAIVQVSTDIILNKTFNDTILKINKNFLNKTFYVVGQRIDIDKSFDLTKNNLDENFFKELKKKGNLHTPTAMDYLVFSRNFDIKIPPFAIGRPGWDSWLVSYCKKNKIPVIDATYSIDALHQNHSYPTKKKNYFQSECDYNFKLAGGHKNLMNIREADYIFIDNKIKKPRGLRLIISFMSKFLIYRYLLLAYRSLKSLRKKLNKYFIFEI